MKPRFHARDEPPRSFFPNIYLYSCIPICQNAILGFNSKRIEFVNIQLAVCHEIVGVQWKIDFCGPKLNNLFQCKNKVWMVWFQIPIYRFHEPPQVQLWLKITYSTWVHRAYPRQNCLDWERWIKKTDIFNFKWLFLIKF